MPGFDRRQPQGKPNNDLGLWKQLRLPLFICAVVTLGLVMKLEITEAAFKGAEVRVSQYFYLKLGKSAPDFDRAFREHHSN